MKIFLILFFLIIPLDILSSQTINFDVSKEKITLTRNSLEPELTIFAFNSFEDSLIVKLIGPQQKVILQEKKLFLGMWTWGKIGEFKYPALYHFYINKNSEPLDFTIKKTMFDGVRLVGKDDDNLKKDLIKKKMNLGLFLVKEKSHLTINKDNPNFFKIPIKIPYSAPSGKYKLTMEVIKDGKIIKKKEKSIKVNKMGFNSFIFTLAHKFSFIYGIISVLIAISFGIIAGVIFRKIL